jgi:hypothetical protein
MQARHFIGEATGCWLSGSLMGLVGIMRHSSQDSDPAGTFPRVALAKPK